MRIVALLVSLLMAVPAAAQRPYYDRPYDHPVYDSWRYRDRYEPWDRRYEPIPYPWRQLDGYERAREGVSYVRLPPRAQMTRIRVQGVHGAPVVTMVEVFYVRDVQRTRVDRRLRRGEGVEVPIDPRRRIRGIAIHTDPRYRGGYSVWGG